MDAEAIFGLGILVVICLAIGLSAAFLAGVFLLMGAFVLNTHFDGMTWLILTIIIAIIEGSYFGVLFITMN